jgi:hypothetical protein
MTLQEQLHADHKARLARLGVHAPEPPRIAERPIVRSYAPVKSRAGMRPVPHNFLWSRMWFWDLVNPRKVTEAQYAPPVRRIIDVVAKHYGVSATDIVSARRTADVVLPRQVAIYIARTHTPLSTPQIGRALGGRDHTTIGHAVKRIRFYMERSPELRSIIDKLTREVGPI